MPVRWCEELGDCFTVTPRGKFPLYLRGTLLIQRANPSRKYHTNYVFPQARRYRDSAPLILRVL